MEGQLRWPDSRPRRYNGFGRDLSPVPSAGRSALGKNALRKLESCCLCADRIALELELRQDHASH